MLFFSIKDPVERESVVEDYKRIKQEIQERNENRKMSGQNRYRKLQETFNPVVKAQTEMVEKIVQSLNEIKPVKEEKIPPIPSKKRRLSSEDEFGSLANNYRNRYMSRDDEIDTSFGINIIAGEPYIGNTPIKIDHNDIIIYDKVYEGTPGLWSSITEKMEGNLSGKFTKNDLAMYEDILRQTNVLYNDLNPNSSHPRSSGSWKWKHILAPIWKEWQKEKTGVGLIDFDHHITDKQEKLKEAFRNLYNRFQHNIEIYNKLVIMLDEMEKINCLTKEECKALNENLQNKIAI